MRIWPSALFIASLATTPALAVERNFSVTSFDRVRIDGPFKVTLKTGVAPFATASGSAGALDKVDVDVEGRTLIVRRNPSSWGGYPGQALGPIEISVGTHELSGAWVNGAGSLSIDRVRGLSFGIELQGSGTAAIGKVEVDQLKVGISGAGSVTLAGISPKLTAIVRGTSSLDAAGLSSKDMIVGVEGASQARLTATETAKIDARGTASVDVTGNPACTVKAEGSATVTGCRP